MAEGDAEEKYLRFSGIPDNITLYNVEAGRYPGFYKYGICQFGVYFNDCSTPITGDVKLDFKCKDSNANIVSMLGSNIVADGNDIFKHLHAYFSPIATGESVYTLTAYIPGTDYKVSADITFIVTDDISGLPTSIDVNRYYFDENDIYKPELVMPDDGSPLTISIGDFFPTYTINGVTQRCDISYGSIVHYDYDSFTFDKPGKYTVNFVTFLDASNWQLMKYLTFIVKSNTAPTNQTPTLTGVPEGDILIGRNKYFFNVTAENIEQMVNWEITCDNDKINVYQSSRPSGDNCTSYANVYSNYANVSGTVTIRAWYEGYKDQAAVATFKVHTEDVGNELILYNVPDTTTLYMNQGRGHLFAVAKLNDSTPVENIDFTLTPKDSSNALLEDIVTYTDRQGDNIGCYTNMYYTAKAAGTCVYTFTAAVPGTNYSVSKDITFTIVDDAPAFSGIEINRDYFDENNIYKEELVLPDNGALVFTLPEEAIPTYVLNGERFNCITKKSSQAIPTFWFRKAGKYSIEFETDTYGSNLQKSVYVTFIVRSNVAPSNPPEISNLPTDKLLVSSVNKELAVLQVLGNEQLVEWEVTCDNADIHIYGGSWDLLGNSNFRISGWSSKPNISGTVTVTAYFNGYEDMATVATFEVYTDDSIPEPTPSATPGPTAEPTPITYEVITDSANVYSAASVSSYLRLNYNRFSVF